MGFDLLLDPQNREVGRKLGIATACMFTLPILTYFVTRSYLFADKDQPDNYAGGAAVLVTNLVIAAYCVAAFREEDDDDDDKAKNDKDDADGPRVGVFKNRTD